MKKTVLDMEAVQQLHQAGLLDEAKNGYLAILRKNPQDMDVLHALGMLSVQQGKLKEAITYLKTASQYHPNNPTLYLNLGNALKISGLPGEAERALKKAIELNPDYAAALNNLGTVHYAQEKINEAIEYFQLAITKKIDYIEAYYNLGLAYTKQNQIHTAIKTYETLLQYTPDDTAACFQLGRLFLQLGQVESALKYFLIVEKNRETHLETQVNLATCYLKLGALSEAKIHYLKAHQLNPEDVQILFNLGVVNMQQGYLDQAIQHYQRVTQIDPDYFEAHNNLGVSFLAKQHIGFALRHFREALRIQPHNEAIAYTVNMLAQDKRLLASPPDYVKSLFDAYADHYELHLLQGLDYQIPSYLIQAIQKVNQHKTTQWDILDLGCGTGLCGIPLKPLAKSLAGVDLSPKMLEIATQKNIYDTLMTGHLADFLADKKAAYDLIVASDVFVYTGDLKTIFAASRNALREHGLFAFNTEVTEIADYTMNQSGRFSHQEAYLTKLAQQNHFRIVYYQKIIARSQNNAPVEGHLYVLEATEQSIARSEWK